MKMRGLPGLFVVLFTLEAACIQQVRPLGASTMMTSLCTDAVSPELTCVRAAQLIPKEESARRQTLLKRACAISPGADACLLWAQSLTADQTEIAGQTLAKACAEQNMFACGLWAQVGEPQRQAAMKKAGTWCGTEADCRELVTLLKRGKLGRLATWGLQSALEECSIDDAENRDCDALFVLLLRSNAGFAGVDDDSPELTAALQRVKNLCAGANDQVRSHCEHCPYARPDELWTLDYAPPPISLEDPMRCTEAGDDGCYSCSCFEIEMTQPPHPESCTLLGFLDDDWEDVVTRFEEACDAGDCSLALRIAATNCAAGIEHACVEAVSHVGLENGPFRALPKSARTQIRDGVTAACMSGDVPECLASQVLCKLEPSRCWPGLAKRISSLRLQRVKESRGAPTLESALNMLNEAWSLGPHKDVLVAVSQLAKRANNIWVERAALAAMGQL